MATPLIAGQRLVTADHVCHAVQDALAAGLPAWTKTLPGFKPVTDWLHLPTLDAIVSAAVPVAGIVSPGLSETPARRSTSYDATFRVVAAIYDRSGSHDETQARARTWAALMRTVLIQSHNLSGFASALSWVGEEYSTITDARAARTLGACSVAFDVLVRDVVPTGAPRLPADPAAPAVASVHPVVTATTTTIARSSP